MARRASGRARNRLWGTFHSGQRGGRDILESLGPGLLVTVGFIDPGNWATNIAAGSSFGYGLLWVITLSTVMLIVLQHNAAHLGIVTGECLAEAINHHLPRVVSRLVLGSTMLACAATLLAEVLGGAIALRMLFGLPERVGALLVAGVSLAMLFTNSYQRVKGIIIGFVSLIGLAFVVELALVRVDWPLAAASWVTPAMPAGSGVIIMSVLGAVVMPHNLFLHSELIQAQDIPAQGEQAIERRLDGEFRDTLFSMCVGWAINSAIIILAASTLFAHGIEVDDLAQAQATLTPIVGPASSVIFALALLFAGISSSVTACMATGIVSSGMVGEPYDVRDRHSSVGIVAAMAAALVLIWVLPDAYQGLIWSQAALSVQLPITVFTMIWLTSSRRVMGRFANGGGLSILLVAIGIVVTVVDLVALTVGA